MGDAVPDINRGDSLPWQVKDRFRELEVQLAIFGHHLSAHLGMRPVDLQCLNLVHRHGSISIGALARQMHLPPPTTTGIVDRLASTGWVARERSDGDRRTVMVRGLADRLPELFGSLVPLGEELDAALAGLDEDAQQAIAFFLDSATRATSRATGLLDDS
ncbi:MarR family transcriptional regulator [Georgenia deserti]|uniref:MarR family transcriptional regulator n=1 Tax=Georgenia deserti TaxID=2093781 RepID=A0ABW4LA61_9MICO